MLPDGDLKKYIVQPHTPFAPQSRQGNATIQDFSVATVWELNADWSGGTGHTRERKVESSVYAYAQGNNVAGGLGTTLFTAQKGKLLPAPAHADANVGGAIAAGNIKQFIEFKSRLYGLTDENPGKIYQWDSGGTTPTLKLTLSATTAYTATAGHISFTAATKTISDSDNGLGFLKLGDTFTCTGTSSNPGPFTIATEGTGSVVVNETVVNETPAGAVAFVLPATTGIKMTTDGNKL
jgi:hypothetical protein